MNEVSSVRPEPGLGSVADRLRILGLRQVLDRWVDLVVNWVPRSRMSLGYRT